MLEDRSKTARVMTGVLILALVGSLALNLDLSSRVRELLPLRGEVQRMRSLPAVGQWVPTVVAQSTTGDSVVIGETASGRAQVLIFFTTTCEYCKATVPVWKAISEAAASDGNVDVIWVSGSNLDSARAYALTHGITDPVVKFPDSRIARIYKANAVPLTVVLDRLGRVSYVRASVISDALARDSVVAAARIAAQVDSATAVLRDSMERANGVK